MTGNVIEQRTRDCKQSMIRAVIDCVCDLPFAGSNTNWGEAITALVVDLVREVDTILDRIRDVANEQCDWHETGDERIYLERRLREAVEAGLGSP